MTRIEAIREAIRDEENRRRLYSSDQVGMKPLKGAEKEHERICGIIAGLKEICQAMQAESVRKSIAEWQMDVAENGPSALKVDDLL